MTAPKPAPPLGKAVQAYLDTIKVPKTGKEYAYALRLMTGRFGEDTPLAGLDAGETGDWLEDTWGSKSAATYNLRAAAVRSAHRWWRKRRWISAELLADVLDASGRVKDRAVWPSEILTPGEAHDLLNVARRPYPTSIRNRALIAMLYRSGLRISEILALKPGNLDHNTRSIRLTSTKAGQAQTRYWHETADDALLAWEHARAGLGINGNSELFTTLEGGPLSATYVRAMLRRYATRAGITKRVHPHMLRHTFAVELMLAGKSPEAIRQLLGQSSVAVAARYLAHLTNADAGRELAAADLAAFDRPATEAPEDLTAKLERLEEQIRELQAARGQG